MKLISSLVVLLLLSLHVSGQEFKKMSDAAKCKTAIQKKQNTIKSLTADFKETVYSEMFDDSQKATGKLSYKKSNKIRWEHTSPTKKILLIDGSKVKYSENGKEVKNPTSKAVVKKIQDLMVKMLSGSFLDGKDFAITYYENTTQYKLVLKPNSERLSKYIESIVLFFDKKDCLLKEMSLVESEDEKIVYTFSNAQVNPTINDTKFTSF